MNARLESDLEAFKNTIKELRGELQNAGFQKEEAVQKVENTYRSEITLLKKSLGIARENLENLKSKKKKKNSAGNSFTPYSEPIFTKNNRRVEVRN